MKMFNKKEKEPVKCCDFTNYKYLTIEDLENIYEKNMIKVEKDECGTNIYIIFENNNYFLYNCCGHFYCEKLLIYINEICLYVFLDEKYKKKKDEKINRFYKSLGYLGSY